MICQLVRVKEPPATHDEPDTNHVWRIVPQSLLEKETGLLATGVECPHEGWADLKPHQDDAILLLKQYMHSPGLSQTPLVLKATRPGPGSGSTTNQ